MQVHILGRVGVSSLVRGSFRSFPLALYKVFDEVLLISVLVWAGSGAGIYSRVDVFQMHHMFPMMVTLNVILTYTCKCLRAWDPNSLLGEYRNELQ